MSISDEQHELTFGKYKGKTIGEVWELPNGPSWLYWVWENLEDKQPEAHHHIERLLHSEGIDSKSQLPWRGR